MHTHAKDESTVPKEPDRQPAAGAGPPPPERDLSKVAGIYLQVFGRPPLGDHPELDGYTAGRVLAEEYPEKMQKVMNGFRKGAAEVQKRADGGGESRE